MELDHDKKVEYAEPSLSIPHAPLKKYSETQYPLKEIIIEYIRNHGALSFAEYMQLALYHPEYGYYISGQYKMGWEGDYITSATISSLFAACLGKQLHTFWEELSCPVPFVVVEQGAGNRALQAHIYEWLQQQSSVFAEALEYHTGDMHEGNDVLQTEQFPPDTSVLFSNELIDAFPVQLIEKQQNTLQEVYIDRQGDELIEVLQPASSAVVAYCERYMIPWHMYLDGWRAEVHLQAEQWMMYTAKHIQRGYVMTIDYGDEAEHLFISERMQGTIACYRNQHYSTEYLQYTGQQDITTHVNFSALQQTGAEYGLETILYSTQGAWLRSQGIEEELQRIRQENFAIVQTHRASDAGQIALLQWKNLQQQAQMLTDPTGMGNFKVLVQRKNA